MKKKLFAMLLSLAMVITMMPTMTMTAFANTPLELNFTIGSITKDDLSNLPNDNLENTSPDNICEASTFNFYLFNSNNEIIAYRDSGEWKNASGEAYGGTPDYSKVAYVVEEIKFTPTDSFEDTMTIIVNGGSALPQITYGDLHTGIDGYLVRNGNLYVDIKFCMTNWGLLSKAMSGGNQGTVSGVFEVSDEASTTPTTRTIKLLTDISASELDSALEIHNSEGDPNYKDIVLNLNGCILDGKRQSNPVINVYENGKLTINDDNPTKTHKLVQSADGIWHLDDTAVENYTTITGGCITGAADNITSSGYALGCNGQSTITLNAGNIAGNNGGGLLLNGANFEMNGGTISYNTAIDGGGIYADTTIIQTTFIKLNGGEICHNTAYSNGGGIYSRCDVEDCHNNLIITGTNIHDNSAENGGGIFYHTNSNFLMVGGSVTNNTATEGGGGIYAAHDGGGCLAEGTQITMADGSKKPVEKIKPGDDLRVFNHETGEISHSIAGLAVKQPNPMMSAFTLHFSHNIDITPVVGRGFYEKLENKYVEITYQNAEEYIGRSFYNLENDRWEKLEGVTKHKKAVDCYALVTKDTLNTIAEGMLSVEDSIVVSVANVFEFDGNKKIIQEKKQEDIKKWGLATREDHEYVSKEFYELFPFCYSKIVVGKKLATMDEIKRVAAFYDNLQNSNYKDEQKTKYGIKSLGLMSKGPLGTTGEKYDIDKLPSSYFRFGGTAKVYDNSANGKENNYYLCNTDTGYVQVGKGVDDNGVAAPESGMRIGISLPTTVESKFTEYTTSSDAKYFFSDSPEYIIRNNDDGTPDDMSDDYLELVESEGTPFEVDGVGYASIDDAIDVCEPGVEKTIKMNADVTLSQAVEIPSNKKIVLDLNGHVLDRGLVSADGTVTNDEHGSAIEVYGKLTIKDSTPETSHEGFVDANGLWHLGTGAGTSKTINGGIITGGTGTYDGLQSGNYGYFGGGLRIKGDNANVTLKKGTIVGNAVNYLGAGVAVQSGANFTMDDGAISYNIATDNTHGNGSGFCLLDQTSATMNGGTINHNKSNRSGGGVYLNSTATFVINNGTISNNEAGSYGGGIFTNGTTTIKSACISNNSSEFGAGIQADTKSTLSLTAPAGKEIDITGNSAASAEGGVASWNEIHLSGKVVIKDNTCTDKYNGINRPINLATMKPISIDGALTGSEIFITHAYVVTDEHDAGVLTSGYTKKNSGAGLNDFFRYDGPNTYYMDLSANGELEVLERPLNSYEVNVSSAANGRVSAKRYAISGESVTLTVRPNTGYFAKKITYTPSGESARTITPVGGVYGTYSFTMPNEDVTINAEFVAMDCELNGQPYESFADAYNALTANNTIKIYRDINLQVQFAIQGGKNVELDLNGYKIKRTYNVGNNPSMFYIASSADSLTIKDTSANHTGMICSGDSAYGAAIWNEGTLNFVSGTICDCKASNAENAGCGGAIYNHGSDAKLTMGEGAVIRDCTAQQYGGAIFNFCGKTTINGGQFINCSVTNSSASGDKAGLGGAIWNNNSLIINSGTIDNCHSAYAGGAIFSDGRDIALGLGLGTVLKIKGCTIKNSGSAEESAEDKSTSEIIYLRNSKMEIGENSVINGEIYTNNKVGDSSSNPQCQIDFTGGSFNGTLATTPSASACAIQITGGKFTFDPTPYVPTTGYEIKSISEAPYSYEVVKKSGGGGADEETGEECTVGEYGLEIKATIENGIAKIDEIQKDSLQKFEDNVKGNSEVDSINLDFTKAEQEVKGVEFTKSTLENVQDVLESSQNNISNLVVKVSEGTVSLDARALEAVTEQATGNTIILVVDKTQNNQLTTAKQETLKEYNVNKTFEAFFESNGQRIHDFKGGIATVSMKFEPDQGSNTKNYKIYYLDDNAKMHKYATKYEDGMLVFATDHFSDYVIVYDGKVDVLLAQAKSSSGKINLSWNKLDNITKYVVYGARCEQKFKKLTTTTGKSYTAKKVSGKKLKAHKFYKFYVVAYDAVGNKIPSRAIHCIYKNTNNKYANVKSIKAKNSKLTLSVGNSKTVGATYKMYSGKKHLNKKHGALLKYFSNNTDVATVSSNGMVTAVGKGTATIYIQDVGGKYCKTTVTVK